VGSAVWGEAPAEIDLPRPVSIEHLKDKLRWNLQSVALCGV